SAGQDQHRERAEHAGLRQECRAYGRNVTVAMDVEVGVDDAADGQRGADAHAHRPLRNGVHDSVCSSNTRACWPFVSLTWRIPSALWSFPAGKVVGVGADPSPGWGNG